MNALDYLAQLKLPDGRAWVDAAVNFQLADANAVLSDDGPPYHFLTRARGASKTTDLAGIALSMLSAAEQSERLYWLASDSDQGALAIDAITGYVSRSPHLFAGAIEIQSRKVIAPKTGASLEVLPADSAGTWGLTPTAVFCDELANWGDTIGAKRLWEAASSAVAKRSDAKLIVLTTSGSPDHFSRKVLDHALQSPLWHVHEVHGPAPWADPERIEEQRQRLPHSVFQQLFENEWTVAEGAFLDPAVIDAAFVLDGPAVSKTAQSYVAALDLGTVNDRTALAIGHRAGEEVHLDRLQVWQGSRRQPVDFEQVERFILQTHYMFRFELSLDPWQGLDMAQRLRKQGVKATEFAFSQASKQKLAGTLLHSLNATHLKLYEAEGLREELMGLRLKQAASAAWSFDHERGGHDDRAVAVALMTVAALQKPVYGPIQVLSQDQNPWASPAERRRAKEKRGVLGWDWGASPETQAAKRWYEESVGYNAKNNVRDL